MVNTKNKTESKKEDSKEKKAVSPKKKYFYAVGRRKNAIATARLYAKGKGEITVNKKDIKQYFPYFLYHNTAVSSLILVGKEKDMDITCAVKGGGCKSQAEAVRLAISRALLKIDKDFKISLKKAGYLSRDPRKKERKKPGLKRARRAPQWQKR